MIRIHDRRLLMNKTESFRTSSGMLRAVELLEAALEDPAELPNTLPAAGIGEMDALEEMAPWVLCGAERLDAPTSLAHMDPPTPWISWAMSLWNARLNQNLLHAATSPFAGIAEARVIDWLSPLYGMNGGHFCAGSTIGNLTAIWAARDAAGATTVVASKAAHLSVRKAARLLGMEFRAVGTDALDRINPDEIGDLSGACLVLTAGSTSAGAIDDLSIEYGANWTHVDAAWAGPLRLSRRYGDLLQGIDKADSISISAHKWLFQPKDSAIVLFRDVDRANAAISIDGSYLATPNVGVQGSRGAAAIPLLATLLAWGRDGMAEHIDSSMDIADALYRRLEDNPNIETRHPPQSGINLFASTAELPDKLLEELPPGMFSRATINDRSWLRSVAANPLADVDRIIAGLESVMAACDPSSTS